MLKKFKNLWETADYGKAKDRAGFVFILGPVLLIVLVVLLMRFLGLI